MSRKRVSRYQRAGRITPAALEAFRAGDREALHLELRLPPWQASPLDVDDGPAPWPPGTAGALTWADSQRLRAELQA